MNRFLIVAVLAVLSGAFIYIASKNIEFYDEAVDEGWSNEARVNKFLAVQRYLEKRAMQVDALVRMPSPKILADAQVLFVPAANQIQLLSQKQMILDWVGKGGVLMLGLGYGDEPPIVSDLQFRKGESNRYEDAVEERSDSGLDDAENLDEDSNTQVDNDKSLAERWREANARTRDARSKNEENRKVPGVSCEASEIYCGKPEVLAVDESRYTRIALKGSEDAKLFIRGAFFLVHDAFDGSYGDTFVEVEGMSAQVVQWSGSRRGTTHAEVRFGAGTIHVFSNLDFLSNHEFVYADHAYFVGQVVGSYNKALIIFGKEMPSLAQLLYQHFFEALFAGVLLIVCALAYFGRRLGKVERLAVPARRSRAERFNALASFRWQNNDRERLFYSAREQVLIKAARRWEGFKHWPIQEQIEALAEHSQLSHHAIETALFDAKECNEHSFIHMIKVLQDLRICL